MARDKTDKTDNTPVAHAYSEAVRRSKKLIQSGLGEEFAKQASGESMVLNMGVRMLRYEPARLLAWAEAGAGGFDALRLGIAYSLEQGEELPPDALQWLVRFLKGDVARPKARAGRHGDFWLHTLIWMAVGIRVSEGLNATRNDASEATSACDAVAEALAELQLQPASFASVKRIWLTFEKKKLPLIEAT